LGWGFLLDHREKEVDQMFSFAVDREAVFLTGKRKSKAETRRLNVLMFSTGKRRHLSKLK
jgi:hypothetical protein